MISQDVIEKVKELNDIVEVVSEKVSLKKSGRNYSGLCPFHHEKTPSFTVSSEKQIYKCFGCGEAGNVITFIMKTRNLSFPEAVKFLAERVNIDIEYQDNSRNSYKDKNERLYKINVEAAKYFFANLRYHKYAVTYLTNRGIKQSTINKFGIGYSLSSWDAVKKYLMKKGCSELDLLNAGLVIKSEKGRIYDRFRNRIIFPVFDYMGRLIGFGGRVLDDSKPKYLNSPETSIFKKGVNLYGLNFAIKNNAERVIIIVEGYMDCISLHQYNINNAVASLGTALTSNQAKLLKRYADKVIIAYDADTAGVAATMRGLDILKNEGFDVRILTVPEGKDPDEYIRNNGRDAFLELVEEALPVIDYRIKKAEEGVDFNNLESVIKYVENVLEIIITLDPVERDIYIKKLSEKTSIKDQAMYDLLNDKMKNNVKKVNNVNSNSTFGQKLYVEPGYLKAERSLLKLILVRKDAFEYLKDNFDNSLFILESHKRIYDYIIKSLDHNNLEERYKFIENSCDSVETSSEWVNIFELDIIFEENNVLSLMDSFINEIKKYKLETLKKNIIAKIKIFESEGKSDESLKLAQELVNLQKKLSVLQ